MCNFASLALGKFFHKVIMGLTVTDRLVGRAVLWNSPAWEPLVEPECWSGLGVGGVTALQALS